MSVSGKRIVRILLGVLGVSIAVAPLIPSHSAYAAQITSRSLTLQAGALAGGSAPGGTVNHQFTMTLPSNYTVSNLGSIRFLYCLEPGNLGDTCTLPAGLDTTTATLGTTTGAAFTSATSTAANSIYITRVPSGFAGGAVTEQLVGVKNPTATNTTFYVRIATYASANTAGSPIDTGTVAASTASQIVLTGIMPESLIFCAGATITTSNGVPDCSSATPGGISFNQLFSPTATATATSQMAASTNAGQGYVITVNGPTLTSGGNTVQAMGSVDTSKHGVGQFGMNLVVNTIPVIGTDITPAANGTNYRGQAETGYNAPNNFKFTSGDSVADSQSGGAGPTDAQIFTMSYIVNVPGSQAAGTYVSTLTYICTATY